MASMASVANVSVYLNKPLLEEEVLLWQSYRLVRDERVVGAVVDALHENAELVRQRVEGRAREPAVTERPRRQLQFTTSPHQEAFTDSSK